MMSTNPEAVVIGASAGALDALSGILPMLPEDFRMPVIVVVHIPPDRPSALADLFGAKCRLAVKEAEDKEPLAGGTVYFAPPDYHLQIEADRFLSLSCDEPVLFSRPSIDVLFETAADALGPSLVAIVLSGANNDGASGLRAVIEMGGIGIVQDPATAYSSAMPEAAIRANPSAHVMSPPAIADYLKKA